MKKYLWTFLFLFLSNLVFGEEKILLKKQYMEGEEKTYASLVTQTFQLSEKVAGKIQLQLQAKLLLVYQLKTLKVDPQGKATLQWKFERIYLYRWQGGMMIAYDTAKENPDLQNPLIFMLNLLLRQMVGKTFELDVDLHGKILGVRGTEDLLKKTLRAIPPAYKSFLEEGIHKLFSPSAIEGLWKQSHLAFPEKPLKAEESWQEEIYLPRLGAKAQMKYTFKGIHKMGEKIFYIVEVELHYSLLPKDRGLGGYEFREGRGRGRYFLDLKGRLSKIQMESEMKVMMTGDDTPFDGKEELRTWITSSLGKKNSPGK